MARPAETNRLSAHRRGYGRKWRKAREQYLKANRWCVECLKQGRQTPATEVDHIERHMGDMRKFWRRSNWQGMCKSHHSAKTWSEVRGKQPRRKGCDAKGFPLDWDAQWSS